MKKKKATARMMMNQQAKWRKQAEKPAKWNEGVCRCYLCRCLEPQ